MFFSENIKEPFLFSKKSALSKTCPFCSSLSLFVDFEGIYVFCFYVCLYCVSVCLLACLQGCLSVCMCVCVSVCLSAALSLKIGTSEGMIPIANFLLTDTIPSS